MSTQGPRNMIINIWQQKVVRGADKVQITKNTFNRSLVRCLLSSLFYKKSQCQMIEPYLDQFLVL